MRIAHYLKKNAKSESPNNLLIVDTEAKITNMEDGSQQQTFRLGCAIHLIKSHGQWYETIYPFSSIEYFWKIIDDLAYEGKKLYVIAHNMAYDYCILKMDTYLSSRDMTVTMRVIDSIFMIKAGNILFISSTNFYRQSLAELGIIFGLSKMESPDFEHCSDSELAPYCMRDCEVLAHVMKQHIAFIHDNDLGNFKPTIAGQAFTTYRHRFMKADLLVHTYDDILQMEKESYRGGRCEAFYLGTHDGIFYLDINSMYPFVMKTMQYPTVLVSSKILSNTSKEEMLDCIDRNVFMLAECYIDLKEPAIACRRDKLIFPIGRIKQMITSPEIELLLKHPEIGDIVSVDKMVTYRKAFIFSEYVDYFYNLRLSTTNDAIKQMSKIMLNSLYGKLGQHNSSKPKKIESERLIKMYSSMMNDCQSNSLMAGLNKKIVRLGDTLYEIENRDAEFARDSIPIIASAVTSYARILLFELMMKAKRGNVLYCDTDSLFVNEEGYRNLQSEISPSVLGKLKLEKSGTVTINGAKDYIFNGEKKLKGVKKNAVLLPDGRYKQFNFQTKNSRYNEGTEDGIVVLKPIIKSVSGAYDKGTVDGQKVHPFRMEEF